MRILTIRGAYIRDIPSFYAEINRVFMADEDWLLGERLDALDDVLRSGYGAVGSSEVVRVIWLDVALARSSRGLEGTRSYFLGKLERPDANDAGARRP